jgi:hypothetical protein
MPLLKSKEAQTKTLQQQTEVNLYQLRSESIVFLDLSATRATCYFNDETRTIRV